MDIADARSRQIVLAAYQLLDEGGLEGLTIRAVLLRTGLSRRAVYDRFGGKDDLMLAVFRHVIGLAASLFEQAIRPLPDPLTRLEQIVFGVALGRNPESDDNSESRLAAAMSSEHLRLAETRPDDLQAALDPLLSLIAMQLADGMEAGVVRKADPGRLAALVYNLLSTTIHKELITHGNLAADQSRRALLARDIWEFCRRAIIA